MDERGERIYWHPDVPEDGRNSLEELIELAEDGAGPRVQRIKRAQRLPDGWAAIYPDPSDPDCLLVTEHETEAEARAALQAALSAEASR